MSKLSINELLSQATCAVLIEDQIVATAWLASNEGHLLTAGHVLGTKEPLRQVQVQFTSDAPRLAHKIEWLYHENGLDFAVLKLNSSITRQPLPIALVREVHGKLKLRGYGASLEERKSQWGGIGEFVGTVSLDNSAHNILFNLDSKQLGQTGYSGGAVFSEQIGAVVAIQIEATNARIGAGRDIVLAMPLYRVAQLWEPLKELAILPKRPGDTIISEPTKVGSSNAQTIVFGPPTQFFPEKTVIVDDPPEPAPPPPPPTPPPTTLSQKVLSVLESCFESHRQSILAKWPENEGPSAETRLDDLKYAFFTKPANLHKIKLGLEFFKAHPPALLEVKKLLREFFLQRLVRQAGGEVAREYERLVFGEN